MEADQKLIQGIGNVLWGIFPKEADHIIFEGMFYPEAFQCGPAWFDKAGRRIGPKNMNEFPHEARDELATLTIELQTTPPFKIRSFTHIQFTVTNDKNLDAKFAYIPEWDSWPDLYMKGVSELTEDEADDAFIDLEDWKKCRARREKEPYQK